MPKRRLSREKPTDASSNRQRKARTELEQFWRKTAKEYGSVITEEELFAHDPELFKRWIAKAAKYEELLESCREIENNLAIKKGALPGLIESVELLEKALGKSRNKRLNYRLN